jgi:phage recombination protein Bet
MTTTTEKPKPRADKAVMEKQAPQTLEIQPATNGAIVSAAAGGELFMGVWDNAEIDILRQQICSGASNTELAYFAKVCQKTGLDPFSRQIYMQLRNNKKTGKKEITIIVGIDGLRLQAARSNAYGGSDDPVYNDGKSQYQMIASGAKKPVTASCTVWRIVQGIRVPFTATAAWDSYIPISGQDFMWLKLPFLMLAKTAEALALRKAFPAETSGLYIAEEMQQAGVQVVDANGALGSQPTIPNGHRIAMLLDGYQVADKAQRKALYDKFAPRDDQGNPVKADQLTKEQLKTILEGIRHELENGFEESVPAMDVEAEWDDPEMVDPDRLDEPENLR